ncbi:flagellar hook-length control protein FliK [Yoonia sp. F2084L]|uniref:flagellar hook-length control protein FliK n=1 Tax=Yoonia sp. F2084L TaxID=2926419 RepID=UPI001FF1D791|nr:flagellar hook-length control protein FliK [Yoonia sp. F2084L]MCK0095790.1 flagellar hook-length control protein FliK [Yoonia sp. F2084L]
MTIEMAGKSAPKDVLAPPAGQGDALVAFGDMLALVESDAQVADDKTVIPASEVELSGDTSEDVILLVAQTTESAPELGAPIELGLPKQPVRRPVAGDSETAPIPAEQKAKIEASVGKEDVTLSDNVTAVTDALKAKDVVQQAVRPSFAQSAVESQLPGDKPSAAKDEARPDTKVDQRPLGVQNAKDQVAPATFTKPAASQAPTPGVTAPIMPVPTSKDVDQELKIDRSRTKKGEVLPNTSPAPSVTTAQAPPEPPPAVAIAQSMLAERHQVVDVQKNTSDGEITLGLNGSDRSILTTAATPAMVPSTAPEMARHAANQIAVVINNSSGKATEIALNPEELGRVRLSMTAVDGAITLHMSTERPETQDLLRRHIDVLAQEFRALGYDTISFSFGPEGQSKQEQGAPDIEGEPVLEANDTPQPQASAQATSSSGLDLRI